MISMVDKIHCFGLSNCTEQLHAMIHALQSCREEFLHSDFILDFEKEWVERYL